MIELHNDTLTFRFPEVHPKAQCSIDFQRTLRIPDDSREYPLPPGLGRFPLTHVDDHVSNLPDAWRQHGGVFLPIYQSEALWISFNADYPCAIKIAAGKVNAVAGGEWSPPLAADPQDYVVTPGQPWLDGFNVAEGQIRQFVAMPLGQGFSAEEQITGQAEHGGLQLLVYPLKRELYVEQQERRRLLYSMAEYDCLNLPAFCRRAPDMGLAPGGLMRQQIYVDGHGLDAWDQQHGLRCFVHLANSEMYQAITGKRPPRSPATASAYTQAGLPWFDYYSDNKPLPGAAILGGLTSVAAKMAEKGKGLLPDNEPVQPKIVKKLGEGDVVREGEF